MINPSHEHRTVLDAIANWVKKYREAIGYDNELANCTPEQVALIARDMGLGPGELYLLPPKGRTPPTNCQSSSVRSASIRKSLRPKILPRCATCNASA